MDFGRLSIGRWGICGNGEADDKKQPCSLSAEPVEMQTLFALCCTMLAAHRTGAPLFLSDLDSTLPPHLLQALISLFADPAANKRGAQLIFTARNNELAVGIEKTV